MRDWKQEVRKRLPALGIEPAREAEIIDELAQHLQDRQQELLAEGASEEDSYRVLMNELNDRELGRELVRACGRYSEPVALGTNTRANPLASIWRDIRYALRSLRMTPAFTAVAILSLALGIGANTAIFELIDAVRLRPLPVQKPGELALIQIANHDWAQGSFNGHNPELSYPIFEQIRDRQEGFTGVFAFGDQSFNMASGGEVRNARALLLSGNAFTVLGLKPLLGRMLTPADDQRNCGSVAALLSYPFWQREFGGDMSAVGRALTLDGHTVEIVGVAPPSFFGLNTGRAFDVALPVCADTLLNSAEHARIDSRHTFWLGAMGRLKPGWTLKRATAQLDSISPSLFEATVPERYNPDSAKKYPEYRLAAFPGAAGFSNLRDDYGDPLYLLLGVAGLVLLIACANLANLLLARASTREHEIAVRLALGASRTRLIRQLLTESLLLAIAGALIGLSLAGTVSTFLLSYISTESDPVSMHLGMDWRMFVFTAALAVLTCLIFGLVPAIRATRLSPQQVMNTSGRGMTASRDRFGLRRLLVVSQVALSLVLLVGALLFVRSLTKLLAVDAGFETNGVLVTTVDYSRLKIPSEQRHEYLRQMLERIRSTPGLEKSAATEISPMSGNAWNQNIIINNEKKKSAFMTRVSPGYFVALGTPLLHGRDFTDRDNASSRAVAVVNEKFVEKYMPGRNPIGTTFEVDTDPGEPRVTYEIVGLTKDTKYRELREEYKPIIFFCEAQSQKPDPWTELIVRSDRPLQDVTAQVRRALKDINPQISIEFHVLSRRMLETTLRERLMASLSAFFGFLAVVLATVGLYGVVSYTVVRRTNEIGIRMALGAGRTQILKLIMREAGMLVAIGIVIGVGFALLGARAASSLLFGLNPHDPITLAVAALTLATVAALASLLPAQRAAKLDPMVALRQE